MYFNKFLFDQRSTFGRYFSTKRPSKSIAKKEINALYKRLIDLENKFNVTEESFNQRSDEFERKFQVISKWEHSNYNHTRDYIQYIHFLICILGAVITYIYFEKK